MEAKEYTPEPYLTFYKIKWFAIYLTNMLGLVFAWVFFKVGIIGEAIKIGY